LPFTYFAHQVVVIPLKCARPRWFDGTALCAGSMAPDFAYALSGTRLEFASHTIAAQLLWSVPCAWLIAWSFHRHIAQPLGAQLPGVLGAEVRALAHSRPAVWITCLSGFIGGLSHVFIDGFTHGRGWAVQRLPSLQRVVTEVAGMPIAEWQLLHYLGHSFGSMAGLLLMAALVERRQFSRWNGLVIEPVPARSAASGRFVFGVALSAVLAAWVVVHRFDVPVSIIRGSLVLFAGVSSSALLTREAR
jgi:hypothetical protein